MAIDLTSQLVGVINTGIAAGTAISVTERVFPRKRRLKRRRAVVEGAERFKRLL